MQLIDTKRFPSTKSVLQDRCHIVRTNLSCNTGDQGFFPITGRHTAVISEVRVLLYSKYVCTLRSRQSGISVERVEASYRYTEDLAATKILSFRISR